jgi:translation initiation factor IF-1
VVSILLPSYTAKTGQSATVLHARSVALVIHKEHSVPKEELLQFEGLVTEILPDARYRVRLDNGHQLVAYTAGRMKKNRIKTLVGDRVTVEVSPYDLEKGRLIFRHKDERAGSLGHQPRRHQLFSIPAAPVAASQGIEPNSQCDVMQLGDQACVVESLGTIFVRF